MHISLHLTRMLSVFTLKPYALFIKLCLYFVVHICSLLVYYGIISLIRSDLLSLLLLCPTWQWSKLVSSKQKHIRESNKFFWSHGSLVDDAMLDLMGSPDSCHGCSGGRVV